MAGKSLRRADVVKLNGLMFGLLRSNVHFRRHPGREAFQILLPCVKYDFHGDALGDFDEVARAAVGFNQAEFGGSGGRDFGDFAAERLAAECVDTHAGTLPDFHVWPYRFLLDVGDGSSVRVARRTSAACPRSQAALVLR